MSERQAADLFARHFGTALRRGEELYGQTPGDFASVVARAEFLGETDRTAILDWLREEAAARGEGGATMGF